MARLPLPGGDGGTWGSILNDFLATSHTSSGDLKPDIIDSTHLIDNAVTAAIIADDTIIEANLSPAVRTKLNANAGTSDHGALTGLGDDDHTQYLNNTRGDARYYTQSAVNTALALKAPLASPTFTGTVTVPTPTTPTGAATKAYVDTLSSRSYIDAADYGFSTTATATANDTAIAAAIAAASDGRPVYIRGYTDLVYHISVPIDLTGGQSLFGNPGTTTIQQDTDTAVILKWGGERSVVSGLKFGHLSLPSATQGNGVETYDLYYSHMYDVQFQNCNILVKDQSGFFFSNQMDTLVLTGYYTSAVSITTDGNTGSVWNNIYTNNRPYGNKLTAYGIPVVFENVKDTVINQLNIEHVHIEGHALLMNSCRNITVNGLHIEQVDNKGWDAVYIMAYGNSQANVSGVSFEFSDIAEAGGAAGGRSLFRSSAGGKMIVNTVNCEQLTNTMSQLATIGSTDTGSDSRLWINGGVRYSIMTGPSIGSVFYTGQETVNAQTGTTYTLTLDDFNKSIEMNNASASTLTVPPNASVALAIGTTIKVTQLGAGQVTLTPGIGVTFRSRGAAYKLYGQYASATLRKRATNEWVISGDVTP
jgi:hypothetical protein